MQKAGFDLPINPLRPLSQAEMVLSPEQAEVLRVYVKRKPSFWQRVSPSRALRRWLRSWLGIVEPVVSAPQTPVPAPVQAMQPEFVEAVVRAMKQAQKRGLL
jgi:hypothetical protein